jgi:hypothetical protein
LESFAALLTGTEQAAGMKLRANERSGIAALFSGAPDLARQPVGAFERRSFALLFVATSDFACAVDASVIADGGARPAEPWRRKTADKAVGVRARIGCVIGSDVDADVGNVIRNDVTHCDVELDVGGRIDGRIGQRRVRRIGDVDRVPVGIHPAVAVVRNVGDDGTIGAAVGRRIATAFALPCRVHRAIAQAARFAGIVGRPQGVARQGVPLFAILADVTDVERTIATSVGHRV